MRDRGEEPANVFFLYAVQEESDDSEEVTRIGAEAMKCRGSKREFNGCGQALVEVRLKSPASANGSANPELSGPGKPLARGLGSTKKHAEQDAARRALSRLTGTKTSAALDAPEEAAAE